MRSRIKPQPAQLQARTILFQKIASQQQYIAVALAQRRQLQRIDVESVIKISTHAASCHFCRQITVGGGNHAHIDMVFAVRAQALQLAALQHAQQLGLHGQR